MREGVLTLNIVVSLFYIALAALATYFLKKSSNGLKRMPKTQNKE